MNHTSIGPERGALHLVAGFFWAAYLVVAILLAWMASTFELFVDESFYWLEGQFPAWSYTEVPGFLPWVNGLVSQILPWQNWTVRLPSYLAALTLPFLAMRVARQLQPDIGDCVYWAGLGVLALPLFLWVGLLATPDIWLLVFGLLAVSVVLSLRQYRGLFRFVLLGLLLALGLNVHVRYWIVIALAAVLVLGYSRPLQLSWRRLLMISLPITLIGMVPVALFNLEQGFALLEFQFGERHPWALQWQHGWFFVLQPLVVTPLLFGIFASMVWSRRQWNSASYWLLSLAVTHWCVYALLGFVADSERTSIHWPFFSYVCLACLLPQLSTARLVRLRPLAVVMALSVSAGMVCVLSLPMLGLGLLPKSVQVIVDNALGWRATMQEVAQARPSLKTDQVLIADNFMTASQWVFVQKTADRLAVLPHPLNDKHGRWKQLQAMNLTQLPTQAAPVLIEHTALKTEQMIPFYMGACARLGGVTFEQSISAVQGSKLFHLLTSHSGNCDIPLVSYAHLNSENQVEGWVLQPKSVQPVLSAVWQNGDRQPLSLRRNNLLKSEIFSALPKNTYRLWHFTMPYRGAFHLELDARDQAVKKRSELYRF